MVKSLIRCRECNEVIPQWGNFGDFDASSPLPGVEWSAEDLETRNDFFQRHRGHPLEDLVVDSDTYISDKPSFESRKVSYFEATNGQQTFLIRRAKEGLDRPATYQLIPGKLQISTVSFEIQQDALRKQMSGRNGYPSLPMEKIKKFIQAFQAELKGISPDKFAEEVEMIQEGENPLLAYGRLKKVHWQNVLRRCQKDLQNAELERVRQFIEENNQADDVLSLLIRRKASILTPGREPVDHPF